MEIIVIMKCIIHIAHDISYLFPDTASTAKTLCDKFVYQVLESGEFVGVKNNLNDKCDVCKQCKEKLKL